ncbi:DUF5813 family protein [Halococcus saccharolyticus]|uniref:Uncharacterized protein n=1 Tax=Halococcus saccharolyticus DSM 5350 TaxID=1227455 RepID=M0MPJ1_9EURY|nr:DUF5813 family protein [Halococcus saccharolyticus]EMA46649.1 hypothetical protein C449_03246 [Halococcus saccharolyticus DSM 5350]
MTNDAPSTDGFDSHSAFEPTDDGFALTTIPFDSQAEATESGYRIDIHVPTLDAATEESVAEAVREGWFETFERRLADAGGVTRGNVDVPAPSVERDAGTVRVTFAFEHDDLAGAADAAKALAEYVEGTYVEGIVPGYTYEPPVADLLARARQQGDGEGSSGAMPL